MSIHRLSVGYFCKLCNKIFRTTTSNLDIDISDINKKLLTSCMVCLKSDGLTVTHVIAEESDKVKKLITHHYTIECILCRARWSGNIQLPEEQKFADVSNKLLCKKCISEWCNNKVTPYDDFSEHRRIVQYHRTSTYL